MERKDILIAVGVTVGAAVLVLFMKHNNTSVGTASNGGVSDIAGGFTTAGTVFIPTESYDLNFNTYKGNVSYSTVNSNTTTTYSPINSPITVPEAPHITGPIDVVVNPPTQQTNTTPAASAPTAAKPPSPQKDTKAFGFAGPWKPGGATYAAPSGGWNQTSVVDLLKSHGYNADMGSRSALASQFGIANYTGSAQQNTLLMNDLIYEHGGR